MLKGKALAKLLEEKYLLYANADFIDTDPIQIPRQFSKKEDIEIAGFLAATIAWGQRVSIIKNAKRLVELMDNAPHDFVLNHEPSDRKRFEGFVHRTFSEVDAMYFMEALQHIYLHKNGLESCFAKGSNARERISNFHHTFFEIDHLSRTKKHVSNPVKGSSAKRLNMYLRWMARPATEGVDFGIWTKIPTSELMLPLDVHTGNVARKLGLLTRKQDDWKAVEELTGQLRTFDPADPVKYDYALFGIGAFEKGVIG
jgi:uncharacterized protein (TIGR02757 family)